MAILFVYLITLFPLLPSPFSPFPPSQTPGQTIRGDVVDRDTRMPLPGASVVVLGTDPLVGTTTDAEGRFVLHQVPLGRQSLQVRFIGFETATLPDVLVGAGKEVVLLVALREQVLTGEEVVVVADFRKDRPLNDLAYVSARSFSVEETRRYAGGLDDPARMASAFAGVTSTGGVSENALVIRGNAPKGVQWRLEGVEIPNPNHFGGLSVAGGGGVTLFSSQLLADSDVFTGAFPAEYGNALSGVFDMNFRTGNPARREYTVQVGLMGLEGASEGPFTRGGNATYLFNYRYSTIGLLMALLPTDAPATYQDLSFKLNFPTKRAGRFEVWGIGGLDGQSLQENLDPSQWEYEFWDRVRFDLSLGVGAVGVAHHLVLGSRTYLRSTAAVSGQRTRWDQERLDDGLQLQPNLYLHSTNARLTAGTTLNHKFSARHVHRTGFTVQRLFYDLNIRSAPLDRLPLATLVDGRGHSLLVQFYTQSRYDLTPRLSVNGGAHVRYFALTEDLGIEPRLGVRLGLDERQGLSFGYGLHSQIEDLRFYFVEGPDGTSPNRSLEMARAHHIVAGYDRTLGTAARVKLEVYYQALRRVPVAPDSSYALVNFEQDWTFDAALVNAGAGRNYGVEATVERFRRGGYYYLFTGSLFQSRYRGGDGLWRSTRFDQRYAVNALFGKEFVLGTRKNLLGLNGRLIAVGGKRRSPVDTAASLAREEVVYDEDRAFAERAPAVFLLDLTVTYRVNRRRFAGIWALQVKNVLGAKDQVLDYNFATRSVEEVAEGFPLPVLSYKVEF